MAAIIFAETGLLVGFFLPGDSLLFFTGFLTSSAAASTAPFDSLARQVPSVSIVVARLAAAAIGGDQVGFLADAAAGRRYSPGRSRLFKPENPAKASDFFERHGAKSIVLARFVPVIAHVHPGDRGVANMRYRTFVTYRVLDGVLGRRGSPSSGASSAREFRHNIGSAIVVLITISLVPPVVKIRRARTAAGRCGARTIGISVSRSDPARGAPLVVDRRAARSRSRR